MTAFIQPAASFPTPKMFRPSGPASPLLPRPSTTPCGLVAHKEEEDETNNNVDLLSDEVKGMIDKIIGGGSNQVGKNQDGCHDGSSAMRNVSQSIKEVHDQCENTKKAAGKTKNEVTEFVS